jgi:hypothetical protein
MMNGKQRARWLSDMISESQRYISKSKGQPETPSVSKTIALLEDARRIALEHATEAEEA